MGGSGAEGHFARRMPAGLVQILNAPWIQAAIMMLVCLLSFVVGLGSPGIWGIREKRVGACVADIVYGHHWLLPQLCDEPRLAKPPLPYWTIASFAGSTGQMNEWTLRLPGLLVVGVVLVSTFLLGREAGGPTAALFACLFLASSIFFAIEARAASTDLYLTGCTAGTLICWWRGYQLAERRLLYWSLAGLGAGLGLLTKGPVAPAILAAPIVGIQLWERSLGPPRSRAAWAGILIASSVGIAWPAAVLIQHPDAWTTWVFELHRKSSDVTISGRGWLYYLEQWPQYLFPWSGFAIAALFAAFRFRGNEPVRSARLAWLWFFGNLALFSLFSARKSYYLLPATPGLAVLAGYVASRLQSRIVHGLADRWDRILVWIQFLLLIALWLGLAVASYSALPHPVWPGVIGASILAIACAGFALTWQRRRLSHFWLLASLLVACAIAGAHAFVLPQLDSHYSHRDFASRITRIVPDHATLSSVGDVDPSIWFYLKDRPRVIASTGDINPGGSTDYLIVAEKDRRRFRAPLKGWQTVLRETNFESERWRAFLARPAKRYSVRLGPKIRVVR